MRVAILVSALLLYACANPPPASVNYEVLSEEFSETPGKTMLILHLLVEEDMAEPVLRSALKHAYDEARARTGFKYHRHPTVIGVRAYPSREHAESAQWIGLLSKTPLNDEPSISIHRSVRRQGSVAEERFGFTIDERQEMYKRLVGAEDAGRRKAMTQHSDDFLKQDAYAKVLIERLKDDLARDIGITQEQLQEIGEEGLQHNWAMPKPGY